MGVSMSLTTPLVSPWRSSGPGPRRCRARPHGAGGGGRPVPPTMCTTACGRRPSEVVLRPRTQRRMARDHYCDVKGLMVQRRSRSRSPQICRDCLFVGRTGIKRSQNFRFAGSDPDAGRGWHCSRHTSPGPTGLDVEGPRACPCRRTGALPTRSHCSPPPSARPPARTDDPSALSTHRRLLGHFRSSLDQRRRRP